uniref:Gag protein n=1 Tax=Volvox carteri f. nagariensis TaxID=3068 RepID=Q8L754_VOLCA|nr:gag protein [Volvox carteri f. nagariensis]
MEGWMQLLREELQEEGEGEQQQQLGEGPNVGPRGKQPNNAGAATMHQVAAAGPVGQPAFYSVVTEKDVQEAHSRRKEALRAARKALNLEEADRVPNAQLWATVMAQAGAMTEGPCGLRVVKSAVSAMLEQAEEAVVDALANVGPGLVTELRACFSNAIEPHRRGVLKFIGQQAKQASKERFVGQVTGHLVQWGWVETSLATLKMRARDARLHWLEAALQAVNVSTPTFLEMKQRAWPAVILLMRAAQRIHDGHDRMAENILKHGGGDGGDRKLLWGPGAAGEGRPPGAPGRPEQRTAGWGQVGGGFQAPPRDAGLGAPHAGGRGVQRLGPPASVVAAVNQELDRRGFQGVGSGSISEIAYRGNVDGSKLCITHAWNGRCARAQTGQPCRFKHPATEAEQVTQLVDALVSRNEAMRKV